MDKKVWIHKHCKFAQQQLPEISQLDRLSSESWKNLNATKQWHDVSEGEGVSELLISGEFFYPQQLIDHWGYSVEEVIRTNLSEGIIPTAAETLTPSFDRTPKREMQDLKIAPTEEDGWYNISFVLISRGVQSRDFGRSFEEKTDGGWPYRI